MIEERGNSQVKKGGNITREVKGKHSDQCAGEQKSHSRAEGAQRSKVSDDPSFHKRKESESATEESNKRGSAAGNITEGV